MVDLLILILANFIEICVSFFIRILRFDFLILKLHNFYNVQDNILHGFSVLLLVCYKFLYIKLFALMYDSLLGKCIRVNSNIIIITALHVSLKFYMHHRHHHCDLVQFVQ